MVKRILYYDCKTAGLGSCRYCKASTNYILDTEEEEIYCCFACAIKNYKSKKLHRKIRGLEQIRKVRGNVQFQSKIPYKKSMKLNPMGEIQ